MCKSQRSGALSSALHALCLGVLWGETTGPSLIWKVYGSSFAGSFTADMIWNRLHRYKSSTEKEKEKRTNLIK